MEKFLHYFKYVRYFFLILLSNKLGISLLDLVWCIMLTALHMNMFMCYAQFYSFLFVNSSHFKPLQTNHAALPKIQEHGWYYNIWSWFKKFVYFSLPLLLMIFNQQLLTFNPATWLSNFFNNIVALDANPLPDQRTPLCLSQRDAKLRKEITSFIGMTSKAIEAKPSSGFSLSMAVLVAVNGYSGFVDFFRVLQKFCYNTEFFNQYYTYLIEVITMLQTPQTMAQFAGKMFDFHVTNSTPEHRDQYLALLHLTLKRVLKTDVDKTELYDKTAFISLVQQAFNNGIALDAKTDNVIKEFARLLDQVVFP